jgi:hypothetical protein
MTTLAGCGPSLQAVGIAPLAERVPPKPAYLAPVPVPDVPPGLDKGAAAARYAGALGLANERLVQGGGAWDKLREGAR